MAIVQWEVAVIRYLRHFLVSTYVINVY